MSIEKFINMNQHTRFCWQQNSNDLPTKMFTSNINKHIGHSFINIIITYNKKKKVLKTGLIKKILCWATSHPV